METSPSSQRGFLDVFENINQKVWDDIARENVKINQSDRHDHKTQDAALAVVRERLGDSRFIDEQMAIIGLGRRVRRDALDLSAITGRYDGLAIMHNTPHQAELHSLPDQVIGLRVTDDSVQPPRRYIFPLQRSALLGVHAEAPVSSASALRLQCREVQRYLSSPEFRSMSAAEQVLHTEIYIDNLNAMLSEQMSENGAIVWCRMVREYVHAEGYYSISELKPERCEWIPRHLYALSGESASEPVSELMVRGAQDKTHFVITEDGRKLMLEIRAEDEWSRYLVRPEDIISVTPVDIHSAQDGMEVDAEDLLRAVNEQIEVTGCVDLTVEVRSYDVLPSRAAETGWSVVNGLVEEGWSGRAGDDSPITALHVEQVYRYTSSPQDDDPWLVMINMIGEHYIVKPSDIVRWKINTD